MKTRNLDITLGALFFGTLLGLGVVTMGLSDFAIGRPSYRETFFSPDVGFLRVGDPVLLHGMPTGKITAIERLDDARIVDSPLGGKVECTIEILATLDTDLQHVLSQDHSIHIEERGMLGGRLIRIDAGQSGTLWGAEDPLLAVSRGTVWEIAKNILNENRYHVREISRNLNEITTYVNSGQGLLGAIIKDDVMASDMRRVTDTLARAAEDVDAGRGLLGQLIKNETLYEEYRGLAADGRRFINTITEEFRSVSQGDGVLAMLLNDADLAATVKSLVEQALSGVEDARESAPVQGIGSFLFGTF